jgi:hypothetical protein
MEDVGGLESRLAAGEPSVDENSAGLRPQRRSLDGHGVAALTQAAQKRLGERGIAEEVLPGRVEQVCAVRFGFRRWRYSISLKKMLVCSVFDVEVSELIDCRSMRASARRSRRVERSASEAYILSNRSCALMNSAR